MNNRTISNSMIFDRITKNTSLCPTVIKHHFSLRLKSNDSNDDGHSCKDGPYVQTLMLYQTIKHPVSLESRVVFSSYDLLVESAEIF